MSEDGPEIKINFDHYLTLEVLDIFLQRTIRYFHYISLNFSYLTSWRANSRGAQGYYSRHAKWSRRHFWHNHSPENRFMPLTRITLHPIISGFDFKLRCWLSVSFEHLSFFGFLIRYIILRLKMFKSAVCPQSSGPPAFFCFYRVIS